MVDNSFPNPEGVEFPPRELLAAHFRTLGECELHMKPISAFMLLGNIQLAMRHPLNVGASTATMEKLKEGLIDYLSAGNETIEALLRLGDNPDFDVTKPH